MSDDLQAIRDRLAAATPAPWRADGLGFGPISFGAADERLVMNAASDIASLLAEVDRLRTLVDALAFPVEEAPPA